MQRPDPAGAPTIDVPLASASPSSSHADLANELDLLLLGVEDESMLCVALPRFLLQRAGIDGVWLGHRGPDGLVIFDAIAGKGMADYLERVQLRLDPEGPARGPAALAWSTGLPQIVLDWTVDARTEFCRAEGEEAGWRGAVCLPLFGADGRTDLLVLYSRRPGFFHQITHQRLVWHLHAVLGLKLGRLRQVQEVMRHGASLQLLKAALDSIEIGVTLADMRASDAPLVYVNPAFTRLTGYGAEQVIGRNCRFLHGGDSDQPGLDAVRAALRDGLACSVEVRNMRADGSRFWNALSLSPLRDASGAVTHYVGMMSDVSQRRELQMEYETTQGLYRALLAEEELVLNATDLGEMMQQACERLAGSGMFNNVLVARAGLEGDVDMLAQAGTNAISEDWYRPNVLGGEGSSSLAGRAWNARQLHFSNDYLADPDFVAYHQGASRAHIRAVAMVPVERGGHRWALLGVTSSKVGVFTPPVLELLQRIARLIGHALDAFDLRRRLQQEHRHISWLAEHDPLTGLLNRRGLRIRLEEAVAQVDAQAGFVAVGILDFDDFKQVNDNYGHAAGDALLSTVAARLVEAVRGSDTVARLGGDEIALVLQGMVAREDLDPMLERVRRAIDGPVALPDGEAVINVRASLGLTVYPEDSAEPDELLRHADQALYAIKQQPRGSGAQFWRIYQPAVDRDHFTHLRLVRERFAAGGLRVFYQPIVDPATARVIEVEALARLDDGNGGLIGPQQFIPLLGRDSQAALMTSVLRRAVGDALHWESDGGTELTVAINVDPRLLTSGEALAAVAEITEELGFAPKRIVIEILETHDFLSVASAQESLAELRAFGCRIALDDIGSAYSSLLRMKELPIDIIKLDQSFIRGLSERPQDLRFVQSLGQLARGLGVEFVAEGAETDDIVEALRALNVQLVQGYGIARPMSADAFGPWLAAWSRQKAKPARGLLTCVAEQLVSLDMDLLIARHYPDPKPVLTMQGEPERTPIGQWLQSAGLSGDHALAQAWRELHAMFQDWLQAGPQADDSMIQSALDHLLRCAGDYLRSLH